MNTRREFIQQSLAWTVPAVWPGFLKELFLQENSSAKIGIQLFSLPKLLDKDFVAGIDMLDKMGYEQVELYGPYPFSHSKAQESWNAITPSLGFSGSGYFGKNRKEILAILKDKKISSPSAHTDLDTLMHNMGELGEAAEVLGHKYVVLPAIPEDRRKTLDDYKRIAEIFNKIGEDAKKVGLKFAYHNHGYGFYPMEGQVPLDLIFDQTDPDLVFFEMDIFWTAAAGADPVAYLNKYPNRYKLLHVKDMKEKKRFSGDGGNPMQWIELFPYMTTAGDGVMDLKQILQTALSIGVKYFFVEQDMVAEPEIALKRSFDYLKKLS